MHWVICGLIIFSFSAPSAVMGVPYAIGTQGIVVGVLLCILYTISVSLGAVLLIDLVGQYTNIKELKDLGRATMGSKGEYFATLIQNGQLLSHQSRLEYFSFTASILIFCLALVNNYFFP